MAKRKRKKRNSGVAYQNKDIVSKVVNEQFKGKSLAVYGIDVPKITAARPTNLPAVEANELRLDNLFEFEDDSVGFLDYESTYSEENKVKYLNYLARIVKRIYNEFKTFKPIKIIIIYTADVERQITNPSLNLGGFNMEITQAFLSEMDSDEIRESFLRKLENNEELLDEDLMRLIVYPLTFKGREAKQRAVAYAIGMAKKISDSRKMVFALKLIYAFSDKFITNKDADRIKEVLAMTKVDRLYAEERREAVEKAVMETTKDVTQKVTKDVTQRVTKDVTQKVTKDVTQRVTKDVTQKVTKDVTQRVTKDVTEEIAQRMLQKGKTIDEIEDITGVSRKRIQMLQVGIS